MQRQQTTQRSWSSTIVSEIRWFLFLWRLASTSWLMPGP